MRGKRLTIGIDEVGRGALAGPVVLAAIRLRGRIRWSHQELGRIRDSKRLTPRRREAWFGYLTSHPAVAWRVAPVGPAVIDRINIARAANLGALRAYRRLIASPRTKLSLVRLRVAHVLLDGGLSLPAHVPHRSIVKGDERIPAIAAASIIAKVTRDRLMARLARKFPAYGFEIHKGYATRFHRRMLRRHGPSPIHRRTFLSD